MLTFGSLFAGIGGFDLGLERAGMTCAWQVEREPYAVRVLEKHWPNVRRHDDVCTFPPAEGDWSVDLICGGFPCQDISVAGKGLGLAGARSGLWHQMHRIIGEIRPRFVLVENVAALLGRGMGTVLGDLSAIGYDAEWHVIPASAVGAPHRRERVWIVAYATRTGDSKQCSSHSRTNAARKEGAIVSEFCCHVADAGRKHSEAIGGCDSGDAQACGQRGNLRAGSVANARGFAATKANESLGNSDSSLLEGLRQTGNEIAPARCQERKFEGAGHHVAEWWATEPEVGRVAHGVPSRVDRLRGLGNAVVPQIVELIGRRIIELSGGPAGGRDGKEAPPAELGGQKPVFIFQKSKGHE